MIIEVVGKEIEKIKGDFESYLNGLNMVGEISYSQYSELYDEGTKQIQRAYELGKSELEKENAELEAEVKEWKDKADLWCKTANLKDHNIMINKELEKENAELKELLEACKQERIEALYRNEQYIKENAELKKQLEMSNKVYNDNLDYSNHIEEQLTKAKKLLERLLITSCNSDVLSLLPNCSEVLKLRVEAEQFLNSEVEK